MAKGESDGHRWANVDGYEEFRSDITIRLRGSNTSKRVLIQRS